MMLTDADKETIIKNAKKYNISGVYLLSAESSAVLGLQFADPRVFFRFYGELLRALSTPVDVVDLSVKSLYSGIVEKEGVKIYG
jgi:uncharacterized protein